MFERLWEGKKIMNDVIKNLYALFDAAFEENMNGRGTDITRMVTTFIPDAIQNLQAYEDNTVIFPQTIGNLTYYSKEDLFEWITTQQELNKKFIELNLNRGECYG